jgi:putative oxidoreductase
MKIARLALVGLRWALGLLFLVAGALKLASPALFTTDIANYLLFPTLAPLLATTLPAIEIVVGGALLALGVPWRRAAALCAAGLMLVFTIAASSAFARGIDIACGCFGSESGPIGWLTLARDIGLLAVAVAVLALDREAPRPVGAAA